MDYKLDCYDIQQLTKALENLADKDPTDEESSAHTRIYIFGILVTVTLQYTIEGVSEVETLGMTPAHSTNPEITVCIPRSLISSWKATDDFGEILPGIIIRETKAAVMKRAMSNTDWARRAGDLIDDRTIRKIYDIMRSGKGESI
jgi:hypothetical protein